MPRERIELTSLILQISALTTKQPRLKNTFFLSALPTSFYLEAEMENHKKKIITFVSPLPLNFLVFRF